ncbi:hypothetical protein BD311DRAFT_823225, partial [Dichomitus squalens]
RRTKLTEWLVRNHYAICAKRSAAPSIISPPSGCRRSRRVPLGLILVLPRNALAVDTEKPTPVRCSRLSGMGDSDCAEWARRIARLSFRLVSDMERNWVQCQEANRHWLDSARRCLPTLWTAGKVRTPVHLTH